ncbi:DUF6538 domain-containing protein [Marinobacterium rhizophilum]|uniref:DUF6538 domain-containing protein n=1 Tax=Marinobacterium rhizophilum TaxID=420402 RepID=UPI003B84834D
MARPSAYIESSRHSIFYFCIRIPKPLRSSFPRPDIRRSLETKCRREAVIRRASMLEQVQSLFSSVEEGRKADLSRLS